jgi:hypothetical protein
MVVLSLDAAWSSGATGMALATDIDARPRPIAKKDAARIFMGIPFCCDAKKNHFRPREREITNGGDGDANAGASADANANGGASADANGRDGANVLLPA